MVKEIEQNMGRGNKKLILTFSDLRPELLHELSSVLRCVLERLDARVETWRTITYS